MNDETALFDIDSIPNMTKREQAQEFIQLKIDAYLKYRSEYVKYSFLEIEFIEFEFENGKYNCIAKLKGRVNREPIPKIARIKTPSSFFMFIMEILIGKLIGIFFMIIIKCIWNYKTQRAIERAAIREDEQILMCCDYIAQIFRDEIDDALGIPPTKQLEIWNILKTIKRITTIAYIPTFCLFLLYFSPNMGKDGFFGTILIGLLFSIPFSLFWHQMIHYLAVLGMPPSFFRKEIQGKMLLHHFRVNSVFLYKFVSLLRFSFYLAAAAFPYYLYLS